MTPRQIERRRAQLFKLTHGAEFVNELARLALRGIAAEKVVEVGKLLLDANTLGPLDLAARYGPDVDPQQLLGVALNKMAAALAELDKETKVLTDAERNELELRRENADLRADLAKQSDGFRVAIETFKQVAAKLEADLAAAREAVRVLGEEVKSRRRGVLVNRESGKIVGVKIVEDAMSTARNATNANPIASAAVRGEGKA